MNFKLSGFLMFLVFFYSCAQVKSPEQRSFDLMSIAYHHNAAETKALQLQAYNVAQDNLAKFLKLKTKKPLAVVLDIDETVLDNSPYQIKANISNSMFPAEWLNWTQSAKAEVIAGAKNFIHYAQKHKVQVFLITNRGNEEKEATFKNLALRDIKIDENHIFFKADTSSKEVRRMSLSKNYNLALLIGDNLADFDVLYDKKSLEARSQATDLLAEDFGRKYIILPNPMYGDWEGSIYEGKYPKTSEEKDKVLKDFIKKQ